MKLLKIICCLAALLSSTVEGQNTRDAILFRNGDVLLGKLRSIDRDSGIQWNRSDALNTFQFAPEKVAQVEFGNLKTQELEPSTNLCSVHLQNGDMLQGNLLGYDGDKVTLDTWFAGELELPKNSVALIVPLGLPKPTLFAGPTGLEGWTMGKVNAQALVDSGEWVYSNGAFYAMKSASIARDLKLPDTASIQFDLEWRGFFHVAVALYSAYLHPINLANKETEPNFGGFYSLQLNPFSANLLPVKQTEPLRYLGQAAVQQLAQTNSAHIDIRVSKSKKLIALMINGTLVKQWTDDDFAGTGTGVRFVHQGQGAVKLTNIRVTEWDGVFEEPIAVTPNKTQDIARLKNGDRVIGSVKAIRNGSLSIEGAGTILDVPLMRVKQIELASGGLQQQKPSATTVRAYFASGVGRLTLDLEKWGAEEISAKSDSFGPAKLKPEAFSKMLFDLANEQAGP